MTERSRSMKKHIISLIVGVIFIIFLFYFGLFLTR